MCRRIARTAHFRRRATARAAHPPAATESAPVIIREARDEDSKAIQEIIAAAFAEYPGCVFDLDELPELRAPKTSFNAEGGVIWVAERVGGEIVGSVAVTPDDDEADVWELRKLYLRASARGTGLGRRLIEHAQAYVEGKGAARLHLWSDTRFITAHAVYTRTGFLKLEEARDLHDLSNTTEFHFVKELKKRS